MKEDAIIWIIGLIICAALGIVAIVAYDIMNTVIEGYFFA